MMTFHLYHVRGIISGEGASANGRQGELMSRESTPKTKAPAGAQAGSGNVYLTDSYWFKCIDQETILAEKKYFKYLSIAYFNIYKMNGIVERDTR